MRIGMRPSMVTLAANETLVDQGEPGTELYLLLEGSAEAWLDHGGANPQQLSTMPAGSYFGEMAMLTGRRRSADARRSSAGYAWPTGFPPTPIGGPPASGTTYCLVARCEPRRLSAHEAIVRARREQFADLVRWSGAAGDRLLRTCGQPREEQNHPEDRCPKNPTSRHYFDAQILLREVAQSPSLG